MEPVSFTIGIVGLAGQLTKAAIDCYKIFDNMNDVGATYDAILYGLCTQGLLLRDGSKPGDSEVTPVSNSDFSLETTGTDMQLQVWQG